MKKLILLCLALTACGGGNDTKSTANGLADANQPNIVIPTDRAVVVTDYSCVTVDEYTDAVGDAKHREYPYQGVIHYWKDGGYSFSYDEDSTGKIKSLSKYQRLTLDGGQYRLTAEDTSWLNKDNAWTKKIDEVVRVYQVNGNLRHALSNSVNGVDTPYYFDIEEDRIDAKTVKIIKRHTNPSVRDHDGLRYTKIEITCTDVDR
jgi:hypothetical protein